jgi:hypothetical protein
MRLGLQNCLNTPKQIQIRQFPHEEPLLCGYLVPGQQFSLSNVTAGLYWTQHIAKISPAHLALHNKLSYSFYHWLPVSQFCLLHPPP